jgi:oxaloacetate decarboxylase alpha subunit
LLKAAEAGAEIMDTAISSMSMGTSHSPTETVVEMLKGTDLDTGLDLDTLLEIAAYFRDVRKKYAKFESSFLGADTRILASQVPGGMLSNLENQLKEQGASDKIDDVLKEIQVVQKDCGYIPLVTPTSQIVGTQAVFNVLFGRYAKLTQETRDLVTGKYGKTPAPVNEDLLKESLKQNEMDAAITCRPADNIPNEWEKWWKRLKQMVEMVLRKILLLMPCSPRLLPSSSKSVQMVLFPPTPLLLRQPLLQLLLPQHLLRVVATV